MLKESAIALSLNLDTSGKICLLLSCHRDQHKLELQRSEFPVDEGSLRRFPGLVLAAREGEQQVHAFPLVYFFACSRKSSFYYKNLH